MSYPKKGDIYWVALDPTIGSETNKNRPAMIVSNDVGNSVSSRVIVAPITSKISKILPFEVAVEVRGRKGKILLDQIRSIDKLRLEGCVIASAQDLISQIDDALKVVFALK